MKKKMAILTSATSVDYNEFQQTKLGSFQKIRGTQYRPQNTIILIMGGPKVVPLILGKPHLLTQRTKATSMRLGGSERSECCLQRKTQRVQVPDT